MANLIEFRIEGVPKIRAALNRAIKAMPDQVQGALYDVLSEESTESQRRTPVDTGELRRSHQVAVTTAARDIIGTITVGGPAAPYAIYVHENLDAIHPVGQAKFLESTLTESRPFLAARVARKLSLPEAVA